MVTLFAIAGATHLPHSLPSLSADAIIIGVIGLVVAYSLIVGYAALVREAISVYVGLVLANNFGPPLYVYLAHGGGKGYPVTQTEVQLFLLILPIVVLQFGRHHGHTAHKHSLIVTLIVALLTALLLVSSALSQLNPLSLGSTLNQSNLASWIYQFRLAWLGLVPLAIAFSALVTPRLKHHRS